MDHNFVEKYELLSRMEYSKTNAFAITTDENDIAYGFLNLGFAIYDGKEHIVDVDDDTVPEGYINQIDDDFQLQEGDILAREKHVQVYLGSDDAGKSLHFGWGGVNRSYPCVSEVKIVKMSDGTNRISLINSIGETEYYTRLYRYTGAKGE
jgi:hypothetical protein